MRIRKLFIAVFVIIGTAFLGLRIDSAIRSLEPFISTLTPIFFHPLASYDEKMTIKFPVFYDYIRTVKLLTPEDATIYIHHTEIPYNGIMWPIGNLQMCSAFLYPRSVDYFQEDLDKNLETNSYIVITNGFPKLKMKSDKVYLIRGKEAEVVPGNYDPDGFKSGDNGLIKI